MGLSFPKSLRNLDPSYKTDLKFWNFFEAKRKILSPMKYGIEPNN